LDVVERRKTASTIEPRSKRKGRERKQTDRTNHAWKRLQLRCKNTVS